MEAKRSSDLAGSAAGAQAATPRLLRAALAYTGLYLVLFLPTLLGARLLAPGDSILQSVPALYSPLELWSSLLFSGYPSAADPQTMSWYPVAWIFSWDVGAWNLFVISGYVLASTLTYAYVWRLTRHGLAAVGSGIIYGASGFLMSSLPHPHLVHSAAWLPLMMWSVRELGIRPRRVWVAALALATALSALAGYPQTFVYALGLTLAYVCFTVWSSTADRMRLALASAGGLLLGIGMAAILLLPLLELVPRSARADTSFQFFTSGSLSVDEVPSLLFPLDAGSRSRIPQAGYIGVSVLLLAGVCLLRRPRPSVALFWALVAVLSLVLALGAATPLADLMFAMPGYQAFRAPVRHFMEFSFAVSVLAGLSVSLLRSAPGPERFIRIRNAAVSVCASLLIAAFFLPSPEETAGVPSGLSRLAAVSAEFAVLGLAIVLVFLWCRKPTSLASGLVVAVILADLTFAGGTLSWQDGAPPIGIVRMPESWDSYREELELSHQRIGPLDGLEATRDAGQPNVSSLWGIPSASGYNPLILSRYSEFMEMRPTGQVPYSILDPASRVLDLLGVRYLTAAVPAPIETLPGADFGWPVEDLNLGLGTGCGRDQPGFREFPVAGIAVRRIGFVTTTACSEVVADGEAVLEITLATEGTAETLRFLAGSHTAEWAWERSDVQPIVAHRLAPVFSSFPAEDRDGVRFEGHQYVAYLPVSTDLPVRSIRLDWIGPAGDISIDKLVLEDAGGVFHAIGPSDLHLADTDRWAHRGHLGLTPVFENHRAMPRVWLASRVIAMDRAQVLRTVRESRLSSGEPFDPASIALVERAVEFESAGRDENASASIVESLPGRVEIRVRTEENAFLVLADTYYPGWRATIDGVRVEIHRTNYVLRGLVVEPGEHTVIFAYRPFGFYLGAAVSLLSLGGVFWMLRPGTIVLS